MKFPRWFQKEHSQPAPEEIARMRAVCADVADSLRRAGYPVPAFSERQIRFPADFAHRVDCLEIFGELIKDPKRAKNQRDLIWRYLSRTRLSPPSDVLDRIEDEDVIEIYDMHGDQTFRNLKYFSLVSMTVEDLVSMNWKRDFRRTAKVTLELVELVLRFATGYFRTTFDCAKIPVHTVEETIARHNKIELRLRLIAPLKRHGKCEALMVISRARILEGAAWT